MNTFYYNAAYPGSGKTEAALRYATAVCGTLGQKALFILPTIDLIKEQARRAACMIADEGLTHVAIHTIHSREGGRSVKERLIAHLESIPHAEPEILMITLRAFLDLSPWPNKHVWRHVFVDEAFNPFEDHSLQLVENSRVLRDRLELVDPSAEFSLLRARRGAGVRDSVNCPLKRKDAVNQLLRPILSRVINPNFSIYVDVASWQKPEHSDPRIFIYSEINPSAFEGFESVIFMGAWLQNHAFFRHWQRAGYRFEPHHRLEKLVGNRLWNRSSDRILYLTEEHWTASYARKQLPDGQTPLEHIDRYLLHELHGFRFGWTKNAWQKVEYEGGVSIPPKAAGLNCYSDLQVLVWLPAILPHPNMWKFLSKRGLVDHEVRMEFYWLPLAQFMARGADRRRDYDGSMVKVVPDLPAAQFLRELFQSPIERVGTIAVEHRGFKRTGKAGRPKGHPNRGGRPRSKLTDAERRKRRNEHERERYAAQRYRQSPGGLRDDASAA